jgi:cell division septum initiation protein DivIVA
MDLMNHNPDTLEKMQELAFRLSPQSEVGSLLCDAADQIHDLKQENLALEGRLEASRDFCDHYRKSIAEVIRILENPYLTVGGTSEAYGLLKKAIGQ